MKFLITDRKKIEQAKQKLYETIPVPVPCDFCALAHHFLCSPCTKKYRDAEKKVIEFYKLEGIIG